MPRSPDTLKALIDGELAQLADQRVLGHIQSLLVRPHIVLREWDYGRPGERYPCWTVLEDKETGIAYCESGFGPHHPWGLVWLRNDDEKAMSMGMDSSWFSSFLETFFDSRAACALPIWRVFKVSSSRMREPLTEEGSWDTAWRRIIELRNADPMSRYECGHSIAYGQPDTST